MVRSAVVSSLMVICLGGIIPNSSPAQEKLKGIELYEAKKYGQAETELQDAVNSDPDNLTVRYYLGLTLLALEKYERARAEFTEAQEIISRRQESFPRLDQVKVGLARACMEQKEYNQAQQALDDALELNSDNPEIFLYRGKLGLHQEKYEAAAKELDKAIELKPDNAYAHYYAGIAYSNIRRPDKMVNHFQTFLKLAPDAPEARKVQSLLKSVR